MSLHNNRMCVCVWPENEAVGDCLRMFVFIVQIQTTADVAHVCSCSLIFANIPVGGKLHFYPQ